MNAVLYIKGDEQKEESYRLLENDGGYQVQVRDVVPIWRNTDVVIPGTITYRGRVIYKA